MNKPIFITTLILISNITAHLGADAVLVAYLRYPPNEVFVAVEKELKKEEIADTLHNYVSNQTPGKLAQKMVQGQLRDTLVPTLGGFLAMYNGYYTYSSPDGEIAFPLRHTIPKTYLVITTKVNLLKIKGDTIDYPELGLVEGAPTLGLVEGAPTKIYMYEKKQDEKSKNIYWRVSESPIPQDKKINPISIVLLTNPANIEVKAKTDHELYFDYYIGTKEPPQLQIPSPYVFGVADNDRLNTETLDMLKYFEPIQRQEQKVDDLKTKSIFENS